MRGTQRFKRVKLGDEQSGHLPWVERHSFYLTGGCGRGGGTQLTAGRVGLRPKGEVGDPAGRSLGGHSRVGAAYPATWWRLGCSPDPVALGASGQSVSGSLSAELTLGYRGSLQSPPAFSWASSLSLRS